MRLWPLILTPRRPRVEVITSVQRRRRWTTTEKVRLVEEAMQPGLSVSYVGRVEPALRLEAAEDRGEFRARRA
jgi:Transposase